MSTYDSLTSYYNRIGDRFHDCGKWDQLKKEQNLNKRNIPLDDQQNHFHLKQIQTKSSSSNPNNSLLVKEISFNEDDNSSQSSFTTITHQHNGLIVTNHQH